MEAFAANVGHASSCSHFQSFSSNQITRTFSISASLSSFNNNGRNSCQINGLLSFHSKIHDFPFSPLPPTKKASRISPAMATGSVQQVLPPALDSTSGPPQVFDGTTSVCGLPGTVKVTLERQEQIKGKYGLQDKIELVQIDMKNRPDCYKEKVYPANKVSALEHNNEVKGESLELIKYIDSHFEGPYNRILPRKTPGDAFDSIETALSKFEDGPFFLGQFSLVDIAYAPFIERFQPYLLDVKKYDITLGRTKLATWIEEINKIEGYKQTKNDPTELVESYKKRFLAQL